MTRLESDGLRIPPANNSPLRTDELVNRCQELEQQLAQLRQDTEEFVFAVSHDLKEPLHSLRLCVELLTRELGSHRTPAIDSGLQAIEGVVRQLSSQLDALLSYSRACRKDLVRQPIDLQAVVEDAIAALRPLIPDGQPLPLIRRPLPEESCDPLVAEVFRQLISNALLFNDKPRRWVEIGYLPAEELPADDPRRGETGNATRYFVRDNGLGIAPRHLEAVFEMFRRLHPRNRYGDGVGGGLTLARKIVERHGGKIWIESVLGEGTTVWFTLRPLASQVLA